MRIQRVQSPPRRFRPLFALSALAVLAAAVALIIPQQSAYAGEFPDSWFFYGGTDRQKQLDKIVGKPTPKLQLRDWINGPPGSLKGKIVVLDFWATWCGPCIQAIPHNNKVAKKYADEGVVVLGVCTASGQGKMAQVAREHNIQYPVAKDPNSVSAKAWGVQFYPTYAVVDRSGTVRAMGLRPDAVDKVIDRLLEEEKEAEEKEKSEAESSEPSSDEASSDEKSAAGGNLEIQDAWLEGSPQRRLMLEKRLGDEAPALKVENWINSEPMSLDELRGKVVVLDFWATWCLPCIRRIPHANEMVEKYGDDGLVFIGVCHTQGADRMAEMVEDEGIEYPVAADVKLRTSKAYHVDGFPDYYIIDRAGNLRVADCANGSVEETVKALLKEPAPDASSDKTAAAE